MASGESWRRVAELLGELSDLSVVDVDETIRRLLYGTCELLGVSDALLGFAVRDGNAPHDDQLAGWRPASPYRPYRFGPNVERDVKVLDAWYGYGDNLTLDQAIVVLAHGSGSPRTLLHQEVMDDRGWHRTKVHELLDACGICDRLIGGRPIAEDVELLVVAYRRGREPRFGQEERERLRVLLTALAGVGRRLALAHGLVEASRPLSRREREALHYLLVGLPEKQVAAAMGLTERSLHHHVTALFEKFGARGRAELMARFLSSGAQRDAPDRLAVSGRTDGLQLVGGR